MQKKYGITIKGVTPILQNRFSTGDDIGKGKKKSTTTQENKVEDTLYQTPKGEIYQPAESIRQCLIEAGKAFKKGKSNMSKSFASFCMVTPDAIPHNNQKWETDRRAVVIPSTKGRVMRNRGKIEDWSLTFEVEILDDNEISSDLLNQVVSHAGHYIGIGDYRPQKKGMFGRFIISKFEEITK